MFSTGNATADAVLGVAMMISLTYCRIWIAAEVLAFLFGRKGKK